jgi:putative GTP pyrophosphokinase
MAGREGFDSEYSRLTKPLEDFGDALVKLMEDLLDAGDIGFHRVDCRVKSKESASRKIAAGGGTRSLESLTDLLGIRIITYFRSEVDQVANVVEREFVIDYKNSVDKGQVMDPDRFGYLSMHFIATLGDDRTGLTEYQRFRGIPFEVQVRSILQHAWAEIEHDLGYKAAAAIPRNVRRRFSRLAGVLELADDEFVELREHVNANQATASETIEKGALAIEIDQDSLSAFVQASQQVRDLDGIIASDMNGAVQQRVDGEFLGRQAALLVELGFHSIEELSNYISTQWELLKSFTEQRLSLIRDMPRRTRPQVPTGIAVYYAGMLRHAQDLSTGNEGGSAYSGISADSLLHSLTVAMAGGEPLPGVLQDHHDGSAVPA